MKTKCKETGVFLLLCFVLCASCHRDALPTLVEREEHAAGRDTVPAEAAPYVTTGEAMEVGANSAMLYGQWHVDGVDTEAEVGFLISRSPCLWDGVKVGGTVYLDTKGDFFAVASGLVSSRTYHYRAYVYGKDTLLGEIAAFTTGRTLGLQGEGI